jgi:hypothetical protein
LLKIYRLKVLNLYSITAVRGAKLQNLADIKIIIYCLRQAGLKFKLQKQGFSYIINEKEERLIQFYSQPVSFVPAFLSLMRKLLSGEQRRVLNFNNL